MKFLIIDDHPLMREGMANVLHRLESGAEVIQASDGEQGLALAAQHPGLSAVLVDLRMAGQGGLKTVAVLLMCAMHLRRGRTATAPKPRQRPPCWPRCG